MYEKLKIKAMEASNNAYAPYSNFRVGAAVMLDDGSIVVGSNQENASYSLTMCAERVALFYAQSHYPTVKVTAVAIASPSTDEQVTPCGACRQVMAEIAMRQGADFDVVMGEKVMKVSELMPLTFKLK